MGCHYRSGTPPSPLGCVSLHLPSFQASKSSQMCGRRQRQRFRAAAVTPGSVFRHTPLPPPPPPPAPPPSAAAARSSFAQRPSHAVASGRRGGDGDGRERGASLAGHSTRRERGSDRTGYRGWQSYVRRAIAEEMKRKERLITYSEGRKIEFHLQTQDKGREKESGVEDERKQCFRFQYHRDSSLLYYPPHSDGSPVSIHHLLTSSLAVSSSTTRPLAARCDTPSE